MDIHGARQLTVTREQAWEALNDPDVLKLCIPGCESVTANGDQTYAMVNAMKVGPVAARFHGSITLTDVEAPAHYTLNFETRGTAAGFAKGSVKVTLAAGDADGCEISYTGNASVGGKIAQVGQRLVDGVAKSMTERFFKRFDEAMQQRHPDTAAAASGTNAGTPPEPAGWTRKLRAKFRRRGEDGDGSTST